MKPGSQDKGNLFDALGALHNALRRTMTDNRVYVLCGGILFLIIMGLLFLFESL